MDERFGSTHFVQNIMPRNDHHMQRVDKLSRHISKMQQCRYQPRNIAGCYDHLIITSSSTPERQLNGNASNSSDHHHRYCHDKQREQSSSYST